MTHTATSRLWIGLWWLLALGLAVYSCAVNGFYGFTIWGGVEPIWKAAYASGMVGLDLGKFGLAVVAVAAWAARRRLVAVVLAVILLALSCLSIWANFTVGQRGNLLSVQTEQAAINTQQATSTAKARRRQQLLTQRNGLQKELEPIAGFLPPATLKAKLQALEFDRRWATSKGCTDATATASRSFCAEHTKLFGQIAGSTRAQQIRERLDALDTRIARLTTKEVMAVELKHDVKTVQVLPSIATMLGTTADNVRFYALLALVILVEAMGVIAWMVASDEALHMRKRSLASSPEPVGSEQARAATGTADNTLQPPPNPPKRRRKKKAETNQKLSCPTNAPNVVQLPTNPGKTTGQTAQSVGNSALALQRATDDPVLAFVTDQLVRTKSGVVAASELLSAFERWSIRNGVEPISKTKLGRDMVTLGYRKSRRGPSGNTVYLGIRLV